MCGRFTFTLDPAELREAFPWLSVPEQWKPRYNITPSQPIAVVPNDGENKLNFFTWGLVPSWAKDVNSFNRPINARAEFLIEKAIFRTAFRRKRCLVLADGFYEWQLDTGTKRKTPFFIHLKSGKPFAFAGLWDLWMHSDGSEIRSCAIITTSPNKLMEKIHNRMPVILPPNAYSVWLTPGEANTEALQSLLKPYPAEEMAAYPVSRAVNSPDNDSPQCIQPIAQTE